MGNKTPLYNSHLQAGAKMVDFGGWDMPIHYGSQLEEHHKVRQEAGVFDVSHMTIVDVKGAESRAYLRYLLANDIDRLSYPGKALYSAMLTEAGTVIDDLIVYNMGDWYRLIVNCATREKDLAWMNKQAADFKVQLEEKTDSAMLAIQGPKAQHKLLGILGKEQQKIVSELKVFQGLPCEDWFFARTGYTGEDGFEVILPANQAETFWQQLLAAGISPIGLGARDTLRLEAGMNLYGLDMDETVSLLSAGMAWTIAWEESSRNFIGKAALEAQKAAGIKMIQVGLILEDRGVMRSHQKVFVVDGDKEKEGEITSGSFSPTLGYSIALARIPNSKQNTAEVEIRNKRVKVAIVKPPFIKNGKTVFVKSA
jgi:aminomethyltransferase